MTKKPPAISLEQWALATLDPPPCAETLRRWVRADRIWPPPRKVGRRYYVDPSAEYVDLSDTAALLERINGTA